MRARSLRGGEQEQRALPLTAAEAPCSDLEGQRAREGDAATTTTAGSGGARREGRLLDTALLRVVLVTTVANGCIAFLEPFVPYLSSKELHLNTAQNGLLWSCATIGYLLSTPVAGTIADKAPRGLLVRVGLLLMASGMIGLGLLKAFSGLEDVGGQATGIALFGCCIFAVGVGMGFVDTPLQPGLAVLAERRAGPGLQTASEIEDTAAYGEVFAAFDMSANLGFFLGPLLGAYLRSSWTPAGAVFVYGGLLLFAVPVITRTLLDHQESEQHGAACPA